MKKIFLECNMGVAGDMLCGALLDLMDDSQRENAVAKINTFVAGVSVSAKSAIKCGISGTKFDVDIEHHNHHEPLHTHISEIYDIIDSFDISESVKQNAKSVYSIIANAESKAHNMPVADVHLHEVGAKDAIIDVTSACYLLNLLGVEKIICSTITTGFGEVKTAHGIMPVPAPATATILTGVPTKNGLVEGELCTPTGAALVKFFAEEFTDNSEFTALNIGYGMGTKDFEKPNCVRATLFDDSNEYVYELRCQIDDMTGEEIGYAINKMMSLGALDAFVTPIVMKKSRPAYAFTVICQCDKLDYFTEQMFKHTTTLGVRQVKCARQTLDREFVECNGVQIKRSSGFGTQKEKIEFDELAQFAEKNDVSLFEARKMML